MSNDNILNYICGEYWLIENDLRYFNLVDLDKSLLNYGSHMDRSLSNVQEDEWENEWSTSLDWGIDVEESSKLSSPKSNNQKAKL